MVDAQEMWQTIRKVDLTLFFSSLALYIISQLVSSERLRLYMQKFRAGHHVTTLWNARLYFIGMAYNLFLPGGVGGDAYKVLLYDSRLKAGKSKILSGVIIDRVVGLLAILIGLSAIAWVFPSAFNQWYGKLWFIPTIVAIYMVHRIVALEYKRFTAAVFPALFMSLIVQGLQIGSFLLLASASGMLHYAFPVAGAFLISSMATAIPVFLGGIGAREVVFASLAGYLAFNATEAVSASLLFSMITIISSIPGLALVWIGDDQKKRA